MHKLGRKCLSALLCAAMMLSFVPPVAAEAAAQPPDSSIIDIPEGMTIEGTTVTGYNGDATELVVPEGVTAIGEYAFLNCDALQEVTLPESLIEIENGAFQQSGLTTITVPENVTVIGDSAFRKTDSLKEVTILGAATVGASAFSESAVETVTMNKVSAIGSYCFGASRSLSNVQMDGMKEIGESAFTSTNLQEVVIPREVKKIGATFLNTEKVTMLTISLDTLRQATIAENAFAGTIADDRDIILTDMDGDVTLLEEGLTIDGQTRALKTFRVTTVNNPASGVLTNQTGADVTVRYENGETIAVKNGSTVAVGAAASKDASLADLEVSANGAEVELTPRFENQVKEYTAKVNAAVERVAVHAPSSVTAASVTIGGQTANAENGYTVDVPLVSGDNAIDIVVTSQDGSQTTTYRLTVTRNAVTLQHLKIDSAEALMDFAAKINDGTYDDTVNMLVELTTDIDMDGREWTPIGVSETRYFAGTFDGQGHSITNLTVRHTSDGEYLGLFGATSATIHDVHVSGLLHNTVNASSSNFGPIAGLATGDITGCTTDFKVDGENGMLFGICIGGVVGQQNGGVIENCVSHTTITGKASGYVGGIVGASVGAAITNCRNEGMLTLPSYGSYLYAGGIVGSAQAGTEVMQCVNNGDISNEQGSYNSYIGGICGGLYGSGGQCKVLMCTNNGNLSTSAYQTAGIVAAVSMSPDAEVRGCLNNGALSSVNKTTGARLAGIMTGSLNQGAMKANLSLGTLQTEVGTMLVHPITLMPEDDVTVQHNFYLEGLMQQGNISDKVTAGSVPMCMDEMKTQAFIERINDAGGNFRLNEQGEIEVCPLVYTLTVEGSEATESGGGSYEAGAVVTIDAGSRSGYEFSGWTATAGYFADASAAQTTFTMPAQDVTITANWQEESGGGGWIDPDPSYPPVVEDTEGGDVDVSPRYPEEGDEVTITPNPDEGFEVDEIIVTDKDGDPVDVTDNGDGTYTFEQPRGRVTITVTFTKEKPVLDEPFIDVDKNDWFYEPVCWVFNEGLMTGTSATTFSPNLTTSRAMIVSILHRLEGGPVVAGGAFSDVADGAWYAEAANWAASVGVVNGYEDGTFRPDAPITREQMASILMNYAVYKGEDTSARVDLNGYADANAVSSWAEESVQWAVAEGIISGMTADTLVPHGVATRAQTATMFDRIVNR